MLATGGHPSGRNLAAALGHQVVPPVPSLFSLALQAPALAACSGIAIDDVVTIDFPNMYYPRHQEELERFKNEIESQTGVASLSYAESVPGTKHSSDGSIRFVGDVIENAKFNYYQVVSTDYFKTYDINVLAGSVFNDKNQADSAAILTKFTTL